MEAINLMLDQSKGEFRKTETLESFPKTLNIRKILWETIWISQSKGEIKFLIFATAFEKSKD